MMGKKIYRQFVIDSEKTMKLNFFYNLMKSKSEKIDEFRSASYGNNLCMFSM